MLMETIHANRSRNVKYTIFPHSFSNSLILPSEYVFQIDKLVCKHYQPLLRPNVISCFIVLAKHLQQVPLLGGLKQQEFAALYPFNSNIAVICYIFRFWCIQEKDACYAARMGIKNSVQLLYSSCDDYTVTLCFHHPDACTHSEIIN